MWKTLQEPSDLDHVIGSAEELGSGAAPWPVICASAREKSGNTSANTLYSNTIDGQASLFLCSFIRDTGAESAQTCLGSHHCLLARSL